MKKKIQQKHIAQVAGIFIRLYLYKYEYICIYIYSNINV